MLGVDKCAIVWKQPRSLESEQSREVKRTSTPLIPNIPVSNNLPLSEFEAHPSSNDDSLGWSARKMS